MADTAPHPSFPTLLQRFFVDYLRQQRAVSPSTVAAYRDTFRLLLVFAQKTTGRAPTDLTLGDLNAVLILGFLFNGIPDWSGMSGEKSRSATSLPGWRTRNSARTTSLRPGSAVAC